MSPVKSSVHCKSFKIIYFVILSPSVFFVINHIAIPATGFFKGTPASIKDKVDPQTEPIDVDHPDDIHSETVLIL
jgi:hypothetical protein